MYRVHKYNPTTLEYVGEGIVNNTTYLIPNSIAYSEDEPSILPEGQEGFARVFSPQINVFNLVLDLRGYIVYTQDLRIVKTIENIGEDIPDGNVGHKGDLPLDFSLEYYDIVDKRFVFNAEKKLVYDIKTLKENKKNEILQKELNPSRTPNFLGDCILLSTITSEGLPYEVIFKDGTSEVVTTVERAKALEAEIREQALTEIKDLRAKNRQVTNADTLEELNGITI